MNETVKVVPRLHRSFDGFTLPRRPSQGLPQIPLNLPDVGDKRLMELFTAYVVWNNFIDVRRVEAEIEEANIETQLKYESALIMASGDPGAKVTVLRAEKDLDPDIRTLSDSLAVVHARVKMLTVLCGNMERGANLLSRELTRRVGRAPIESRAAGWNP